MKTYLNYRNSDLIEDAFENLFRPFYVDSDSSYMKTDIRENDKEYMLDVEMPGFDKKDISLNFENGYLTISAKKQKDTESRFIRRERAVSYSRSYYMGDVNEKLITAKYDNGVLVVTVPKDKPEENKHSILID